MDIDFNNILVRHWIKFDYPSNDWVHANKYFYFFYVKDSIHYKSLDTNDFSLYEKLVKTTNQKEHSLKKYKELVKKFDSSLLNIKKNKIIIKFDKKLNKYIVIDGCHRLAILLYKNEKLKIEWFLIK